MRTCSSEVTDEKHLSSAQTDSETEIEEQTLQRKEQSWKKAIDL